MASKVESNKDPDVCVDTPEDLLQLLSDTTIYVDQDGDLLLVVGLGTESRTFCTSSKVMRLASPVWRAMLSPEHGFQESSPGTNVITLPEDDVHSIFIVLLASHVRFQEVPRSITFKQLVSLCEVCDKYDCISVLQPWLSGWLALYEHSVSEPGWEEWSFIAWVVGDEAIFKQATDWIILTSSKLSTGDWRNELSENLEGRLPSTLADDILDARHQNIINLIEACHSVVGNYSSPLSRTCCRAGSSTDQCDALNLGHLERQLHKLNIWPGTPSDVAMRINTANIQTLISRVSSIESYMLPRESYSVSHEKCGFNSALRQGVSIAASKAGVVQLHKTHLEKQRQKLEPSKMHPAKFQTQNTSRSLQ